MIRVDVSESLIKPVIVKFNHIPSIYMRRDGFTNGALLFRDGYDQPKTEVQCSVFSGFNKGSERIVTINRFKGNITDSICYMLEFVKQRMNHTFIKLANSRVTIDSYPERALFEGIVNAVAHKLFSGWNADSSRYAERQA